MDNQEFKYWRFHCQLFSAADAKLGPVCFGALVTVGDQPFPNETLEKLLSTGGYTAALGTYVEVDEKEYGRLTTNASCDLAGWGMMKQASTPPPVVVPPPETRDDAIKEWKEKFGDPSDPDVAAAINEMCDKMMRSNCANNAVLPAEKYKLKIYNGDEE